MPVDKTLLEELFSADDDDYLPGYTRLLAEKILAEDPNHFQALLIYSRCLVSLGQYNDSEKALDHAEKIGANKLHLVLAYKAKLYERMGELETAAEMYLKAHKLVPNDATYLIYLASIIFAIGDVPKAEKIAREAIECSDGCIDEAYYNLAGYLLCQRRYDEALIYYEKALSIDPDFDLVKRRLVDLEKIKILQDEPAG